jgi:hypothetical protein
MQAPFLSFLCKIVLRSDGQLKTELRGLPVCSIRASSDPYDSGKGCLR